MRSATPGLRRHAALRESDELDVDPVAKGLADPHDRFEIVEADIIVDIDVAARAVAPFRISVRTSAEARASIGSATRWRWMRSSGDALAHAAPLDVGQARRAEMGLVEMEVAVDKRRQEEQPLEVDAFVSRRRGPPACALR